MKNNILRNLEHWAKTKPDDAMVISTEELNINSNKFYTLVGNIVCQLDEEGIVSGDNVAVYMTNCIEMICAIAALMVKGCNIIPIYIYEKEENVRNVLKNTNCKIILCNNISYNGIEKFDLVAVLVNITTFYEEKEGIVLESEINNKSCFKFILDYETGSIKDCAIDELERLVNYYILEFDINDKSTLCVSQRIDNPYMMAIIIASIVSGAKLDIYDMAEIFNPMMILKKSNAANVNLLMLSKEQLDFYCQFNKISGNSFDISNIRAIIVFDKMSYEINLEEIEKKENIYYLSNKVMAKEISETDESKLSLYERLILGVMNEKLKILNFQELTEEDFNTSFTEMGLDSLDFMQLVVWCEGAFGIEFDDDKLSLQGFADIFEMITYIKDKVVWN